MIDAIAQALITAPFLAAVGYWLRLRRENRRARLPR